MWPSKGFGLCLVIIALLALPGLSVAGVSVNVPVGSRLYRDLERLEVKGLIPGAMLSTRPMSREEAALLVREAERLNRRAGREEGAEAVIRRMTGRLSEELSSEYGGSYLKPAERVYLKGLYFDRPPETPAVNNDGDEPGEGTNLRAGLSLRAGLFGVLALHVNPEFRYGDDYSNGRLRYGYLKTALAWLELQAGRENMWWGPGYHGSILLSNNTEPLEVVRLTTTRPVVMPWITRPLGLLKPTLFLARLEEDRDFPNANLLGMRLDFKPTTRLQFGLSRVFVFGGEGRKTLDSSDWFEVFTAQDSAEHSSSPINGNQIVSVDLSYVYVNSLRLIPFSGIKLYTEWGAEDSSGETKSPTGRANICGVYIDEPLWLRNLDLRVEWANTARNRRYGPRWYTHGVYTSGYTFKGRVIGHHMGGDSRDLFVRAQYHFGRGGLVALETDEEKSGVHSRRVTRRRWWGAEVSVPLGEMVLMTAGGGVETLKPAAGAETDGASGFLTLEFLL